MIACVRQLARYGCRPTFPIPGWILRRYAEFSRTLQAMGAELAIHGYQHVDFRSLSLAEVRGFMERRGVMRQKIPEQLEVLGELPRNATGKVRKDQLRARFRR